MAQPHRRGSERDSSLDLDFNVGNGIFSPKVVITLPLYC